MVENWGWTPKQIGELTLDQLWALTVDEKELLKKRTMTASPETLSNMGLLDLDEGISLYEALNPTSPTISKAEKRQRRKQAIREARKADN